MKFDVQKVTRRFARKVQAAYAQAIRNGEPRVPHSGARGSPGGSLPERVRSPGLVRFERWGFVFSPSRLGRRFNLWWHGSRRQKARGREVHVDTGPLAQELEDELARQVRAEDRRTSR